MNQALDALNSKKATYEDELAMSAIKREAVTLYEQLRVVEMKRNELLIEEQERGTPGQERERLLTQVKEDNKEIATMERQAAETQDHISRLQEELSHLDRDLEENQSERNTKYRELRKREETMDTFLEGFEGNKKEELERCKQLEKEIEELSSQMSEAIGSVDHIPSRSDYLNMKEDLSFREGELDKSRQTLEGLKREHGQLNANLDKIEALEEKIRTEMESLNTKIATMEDGLSTYSDLERLRQEADIRRTTLEEEHLSLGTRRVVASQNLAAAQNAHDTLARQLADNETYVQLNNMEKKWSHLEQNNFTIEEYIANKKAELNFEPIKNKVMKIQAQYNQLLIECLRNKSST